EIRKIETGGDRRPHERVLTAFEKARALPHPGGHHRLDELPGPEIVPEVEDLGAPVRVNQHELYRVAHVEVIYLVAFQAVKQGLRVGSEEIENRGRQRLVFFVPPPG